MKYLDFVSTFHKSTKRNYLDRVNDTKYPKYKAAELAKKWGYEYWDGDRRINYGGYKYIPGRWDNFISNIKNYYKFDTKKNYKILDIGCGKGFFLNDFKNFFPNSSVYGLDISDYAINLSNSDIKPSLTIGNATHLPYEDNFFDLVISINTLHNLEIFDLEKALTEINRVKKNHSYICVESYRNEFEKMNLLYWQVTCEAFFNVKEWEWIFKKYNYDGEYSFIYFE